MSRSIRKINPEEVTEEMRTVRLNRTVDRKSKYFIDKLIEMIKSTNMGFNRLSLYSGISSSLLHKVSVENNLRKGYQKKTKTLKVNSSSGDGSKVIGTTLQSMLSDMSDYDIVKQSTMIETLHEAGYDKLSVMKTMKIPSPDEFETIMKAVTLLSKDYTITRKDI